MTDVPRDNNRIPGILGVSSVDNVTPVPIAVNPVTGRMLVDLPTGSGTVTSVSVTTANGVSGSVATATTTPAITLILGAITPSAVQISGLTASQIVGTDASKNLVSLPVATYPSLTELTYVKGVTSAIQTQMDLKAPLASPAFTGTVRVGAGADTSAILDVHQSGNTIPMIQAQDSGASSATSGGIIQVTLDNTTAPTNGTRIGGYQFSVDLGDAVKRLGASINALATETWTTIANGTQLKLNVTANGATTRTTALTLNQDASATFANTVNATTFVGALTGTASGNLPLAGGTMTGDILGAVSHGATGTRITKLWATDVESTNAPTVGGVVVPTISSTSTLTNKRVTKRVLALSANSATPAINTDSYDVVHITSQTAAITSFTTNLTGTPVDGDTLRISVTGTGAIGLTFGTSFEASGGQALSTTTVTTARLDMLFLWNTETSKWRQVAQA